MFEKCLFTIAASVCVAAIQANCFLVYAVVLGI